MRHPGHNRESERYNATLNSCPSAQRSINMAVRSQRQDRYWTRRIISRSFIIALTVLLKGWAEVKTSSCLWKTEDSWALFGDVSCCFTHKLWQGTADCWPETLSLFCRPNSLIGLNWLVFKQSELHLKWLPSQKYISYHIAVFFFKLWLWFYTCCPNKSFYIYRGGEYVPLAFITCINFLWYCRKLVSCGAFVILTFLEVILYVVVNFLNSLLPCVLMTESSKRWNVTSHIWGKFSLL